MSDVKNVFDDFVVDIEKVDAVYRLKWSDGVANEWEEYYPTLSVATARLSALVKACKEETLFAETPEEFSKRASKFLEESVK